MHLDVTPPLLVFGGPYSNLRALAALRVRADELGIAAVAGDLHGRCRGLLRRARGDHASDRATGAATSSPATARNSSREAADDCACGFEEGTECDATRQGLVSVRQRAHVAREPQLDGGAAEDDHLHGRRPDVPRHPRRRRRDQPLRVRLAARCAAEELARASADVVIAGHAGVPFIEKIGRGVWFNPGVIGMPANDGTPDVWYGLIRSDDDRIVLSTHRLAYDHHGAAAAMRRCGHANGYARTLVTGLWPSLDVFPPPSAPPPASSCARARCAFRLLLPRRLPSSRRPFVLRCQRADAGCRRHPRSCGQPGRHKTVDRLNLKGREGRG